MFVEIEGSGASRPLMHATNALNYYAGGLDTRGYHVVNLALHLLNGVLLYLLILMTGKQIAYKEEGLGLIAVAASLLFVVHPAQTEAVTNIVNRSMLLATTFYFLGIILFLKAVTAERGKGLYIAALFVSSLLGMASRENFVTFPLVLFLYDFILVSRFRLRETIGRYKAHLTVVLSLAYFVYLVLNNTYLRDAGIADKGIPPLNYILTEFNVHWTYLRLLLLPMGQNLNYDYPIAHSIFELPVLLSFLGYIVLWMAGFAVARKRPLIALCVFWFLISTVPICFGVAVLNLRLDDVLFEHRLYLPGTGPIVLAAAGAVFLAGKINARKFRVAATIGLAVIPMVFATAAYARNSVWSSKVSIWEDAVKKAPNKWRGHYSLGYEYKAAGLVDKALEHYRICVDLRPDYLEPYSNMGNIYLGRGLYDKAIEQYRQAIKLKPDYADAHYNMGIAYYSQGALDKAIEHYTAATAVSPNDTEFHYNLGVAYMDLGETDLARREFETTLRLDPGFSEARMLLQKISYPSGAEPVKER
jgi:tetratricopeptide (TPR) repeat protein